jgi:hypothetical protein
MPTHAAVIPSRAPLAAAHSQAAAAGAAATAVCRRHRRRRCCGSDATLIPRRPSARTGRTPEERFEKQRKEHEEAAHAAEEALSSAAEPAGAAHDMGGTREIRAPPSAQAYGGGAGGDPLILDGEEAMEAIVQDASAAFNAVAR